MMARVETLLISFLLFLTSWAKSLKESTIDNENANHAVEVTLSSLENDEETIYIRKDDILSLGEFRKLFNPGERHLNDFQFIKETDGALDKKARSINNLTQLEIPELKVSNEESQTERNVDATTIDSRESIKESKSEELSTDTNESTTFSIIGQGKTDEFKERYEDDLEVPENVESTEEYSKTADSNVETSSDKLDDNETQNSLRRSISQNDPVNLDNKGGSNKKPVEIILVDQVNVPTTEILILEKPNEQSDIEKESIERTPKESSSEAFDIESSTINMKDQGKTGEFIEGVEENLEVPENAEFTEGDFKTVVSNDETNNEKLDDIVQPIQTRRSIFQNDRLLLDYKGKISKKPIEFDQHTVPKLETVSLRNYEQSKIENVESPTVAPQLKHTYLPPHLSFRRITPADVKKISNEESTHLELVKMAPDEYKQSNNLDRSGEDLKNERTSIEFNSNLYENAYPYVSSTVNTPNQQLSRAEPNINTLFLKLSQASEHPLRKSATDGVSLGDAKASDVAPQLNHPQPVTLPQQFHNLPPHLSFRRTIPADKRKISNEENTNLELLKMPPDEYKQSNKLDRSAEILKNEKGIENLHPNIHENAFPHTHSIVINQQPLARDPNFGSFHTNLNHVSDHHLKDRISSGVSLSNYGAVHPNHNLRHVDPNNFGPLSRRLLVCTNCG